MAFRFLFHLTLITAGGVWGQPIQVQSIANWARKGSLPPQNIAAQMLILLPTAQSQNESTDQANPAEVTDLKKHSDPMDEYQRTGLRSMLDEGRKLSRQILEESNKIKYPVVNPIPPGVVQEPNLAADAQLPKDSMVSLKSKSNPQEKLVYSTRPDRNKRLAYSEEMKTSLPDPEDEELPAVKRPPFEESNLIPKATKEIDPRFLPKPGPFLRKIKTVKKNSVNSKSQQEILPQEFFVSMPRPLESASERKSMGELPADPVLDMIQPDSPKWNRIHHARVELNEKSDLRPDHPALGEKRITPARFMDLPESVFQESTLPALEPEEFQDPDKVGDLNIVESQERALMSPQRKESWRSRAAQERKARRFQSETRINKSRQVTSRRRRGRKLL